MEHDMTEQKREPKDGEWWWVRVSTTQPAALLRFHNTHWRHILFKYSLHDCTPIAPVASYELVRELVEALKEVVEFRNNPNNGTDWVVDEALAKANLAGLDVQS